MSFGRRRTGREDGPGPECNGRLTGFARLGPSEFGR